MSDCLTVLFREGMTPMMEVDHLDKLVKQLVDLDRRWQSYTHHLLLFCQYTVFTYEQPIGSCFGPVQPGGESK
jgi:hypothetical protein